MHNNNYYEEGKKRNKSITLFALVGLTLVLVIIYIFVIIPRTGGDSLGSSDLVLDSPVQRWALRYAENGIIPFCEDGNEWLSIEVEEDVNIYSSCDGVVLDVSGDIVTIEAEAGIHVQYNPIPDSPLTQGELIMKGTRLGDLSGRYLNLRVKNINRQVYECPFFYLNDYTKSILREAEDVMGHTILMCGCNTISY